MSGGLISFIKPKGLKKYIKRARKSESKKKSEDDEKNSEEKKEEKQKKGKGNLKRRSWRQNAYMHKTTMEKGAF